MTALSPTDLGYVPLLDLSAVEEFTMLLENFHDALLKEFRFLSYGYVGRSGGMVMDDRLNGQLLIQSQGLRHDVVVLALGIEQIHWQQHGLVVGEGEIRLQPNQSWQITFEAGSFQLTARQLFYRLIERQENRPLWGEAVPGATLRPAISLGADNAEQEWLQCGHCASTWPRRYALDWCPQCNQAAVEQRNVLY